MNLGLLRIYLKLKRCNICLQITVLFLRASHILFLAEEKAKINKADCALHNDASDFIHPKYFFGLLFDHEMHQQKCLQSYFIVVFRNIYLLSKTSKSPIKFLEIRFYFGNAITFHGSERKIQQ